MSSERLRRAALRLASATLMRERGHPLKPLDTEFEQALLEFETAEGLATECAPQGEVPPEPAYDPRSFERLMEEAIGGKTSTTSKPHKPEPTTKHPWKRSALPKKRNP